MACRTCGGNTTKRHEGEQMITKAMRWVVDPATPGAPAVFEAKAEAEIFALQTGGRLSQRRMKIAAQAPAPIQEPPVDNALPEATVETELDAPAIADIENVGVEVAPAKKRGRPRKVQPAE